MLIGPADDGVYIGKPGVPGAWFARYGGAPKQVVDHGRWDSYSNGVLWGWDGSGKLLRFSVSIGAESVWGSKVNGWIPGFDGEGQPFVIVMGVLWLAHPDGSFTLIYDGGSNDYYVGGQVITDAHGSWFGVGGGRVGTPGHGFYL